MSDTPEHAAAPPLASEAAPASVTMASIEASATKVSTVDQVAAPSPTGAAIEGVFLTHLNSLPVHCEAAMRPLIDAAKRELKSLFGV